LTSFYKNPLHPPPRPVHLSLLPYSPCPYFARQATSPAPSFQRLPRFCAASPSSLLPSPIVDRRSPSLRGLTRRHLRHQGVRSPATVSDVAVCKHPVAISADPDAQNVSVSDRPAMQRSTTCPLELLQGSPGSEGSACIPDALLLSDRVPLRSLLSIFSLLFLLQLSTRHNSMTRSLDRSMAVLQGRGQTGEGCCNAAPCLSAGP